MQVKEAVTLRKVPVYTLLPLCCNLAPNNNEFGDHASVSIFSPGSGLVRQIRAKNPALAN
ncbi:hypothetical protein CI104_04150 [Citrobacter farmeri]|uniref:Uncharacterized protein n=1 Tax=Citrobacter farmeri TaxID=67824 RepID=A0ACA8D297_9ENTR|nr:hypothetical protein CI104_04150 [Citrobacter farmeri]